MSSKRISKKELKEDAFVTGAFEASHYIQEHMGKIIGSIVGALVLAGVVWMYVNFRAETRAEASLAMFKAEGLYINGQYALAATDFEKLAEDYSGTEQGVKAVYFAADSYFNSGDYDRAMELYTRFRDDNSRKNPLMVNAIVGIGACHEQFDEFPQAVEAYREALGLAEFEFQKIEILAAISRTHRQAGQVDEAIAALNEIIDTWPDNPRSGEFIEIRAELQAAKQAKS